MKTILVFLLVCAQVLLPIDVRTLLAEDDQERRIDHINDEPSVLVPDGAFPLPDEPTAAESLKTSEQVSNAFLTGNHADIDVFSLLDQKVFPHPYPDSLGKNLTYVLVTAEGEEVQRTYAALLREQAGEGGNQIIQFSNPVFLRIEYQGRTLYEIEKPLLSLGQLGDFLLLEPAKISTEGQFNLNFIDLKEYAHSIGRHELPLFILPVKSQGRSRLELSLADHELHIGDQKVFREGDLKSYSFAQKLALDLQANLADPKTYTNAFDIIEEFSVTYEQMVRVAGELNRDSERSRSDIETNKHPLMELMNQTLTRSSETLSPAAKKSKSTPTKASPTADILQQQSMQRWRQAVLERDTHFEESLVSISKGSNAQNKALARFRLLWLRLTLPRPDSAPVLVRSLAMISRGLIKKAFPQSSSQTDELPAGYMVREGMAQLAANPFIKLGVPIAAAAALGYKYPAVAKFQLKLLSMWQGALEYLFQGVVLGWDSVKTSVAFFDISLLREKYIDNGNLGKLSIGIPVAAAAIFMTVGVPHLYIAALKFVKDLRSNKPDESSVIQEKPKGFWKSLLNLPKALIERKEVVQSKYLQHLSDAEHKRSGGEGQAVFTAEQDELANRLVEEKYKLERSWIGEFAQSVYKWHFFQKALKWPVSQLFFALTHFCFSAASITQSAVVYVRAWTWGFAVRSFILSPGLLSTFLYFPSYYSTFMKQGSAAAVPSKLNGGLRSISEWTKLRLQFDKEAIADLRAFESKLVPVELAIQREVLRKVFQDALVHATKQSDIRKLIASGKFNHISDRMIAELSFEQKIFVQTQYTLLYNAALEILLKKLTPSSSTSVDIAELKQMYLTDRSSVDTSDIDSSVANAIVSEAYESSDSLNLALEQAALVRSEGLIGQILSDVKNYLTPEGYQLSVARAMNPENNRQVKRIKTVQKQENNPQAMARAVRSTMVSILVDKPIELTLMFLMLAGVQEGVNKPLYDEMFGPNSFFYLGRMAIWNGFILSLITSVPADLFMKLQADEMHEGKFGEVPSSEEAKLGYRHWFFKKMNSEGNSIRHNHAHYVQLVLANMKAALVFLLVTSPLALGRALDLDIYFTGYFLCYMTPHWAIGNKVEQGFELSTGFFAESFPEELRSHPKVQEYLTYKARKQRLKFNLLYKMFWENPSALILSIFQTAQSATLGKRGFARLLFFGDTPTELFSRAILSAKDSWLGKIPGATAVLDACHTAFTNNYTDWKDKP